MAGDSATLKIVVDSAQAASAAKSLDTLAGAAKKADGAVAGLQGAARSTGAALTGVAGSSMAAGRSIDGALTGAAQAGVGSFMRLTAASTASKVAMAATVSSIVAGAGQLAAVMIPGGVLVTAVTFGLRTVIDMFTGVRDEMKQTQEDFVKRIEEMRVAANTTGIASTAFSIQQERNALQRQLDDANAGGASRFSINNYRARRTLPAQIAAKDKQLQQAMAAAMNPAAQYAPSSGVFGVTVTADTAERAAKDQQDARDKARRTRETAESRAEAARERAQRAQEVRIEAQQEEAIGRTQFAAQKEERRLARFAAMSSAAGYMGATNTAPDALPQAKQGMTEMAQQAEALFQSLADGMQRTLAGAISGLFTNGIRSAADFARGLRDLLINAFSEVLASRAMRALIGGGADGSGGLLGGLLSKVGLGGAGKATPLGGGILAGVGGLGVGAALGRQFGTGAGVLGGAATGAALGTIVPGIGNVAGAIIGGLAGAIGGLFGGEARKKAKEAEKAAIEAARKQFEEDKKAEVDSMTGVYLAPAGFNVNGYRFNAGRPTSQVFTGAISITVPEGTTQEQARALLIEFETLQRAQGLPAGALPRGR